MATDSTELTFVRCPSCKSLVPATATRCRICSVPLDVGAEQDDNTNEAKGFSRVRQRTASLAPDQVTDAMAQFQDTSESPETKPLPVAATPPPEIPTPVAESEEVDPLGAFMEEVEDDDDSFEEPVVQAAPSESSSPSFGGSQGNNDDDEEDDFDAFEDDEDDDPLGLLGDDDDELDELKDLDDQEEEGMEPDSPAQAADASLPLPPPSAIQVPKNGAGSYAPHEVKLSERRPVSEKQMNEPETSSVRPAQASTRRPPKQGNGKLVGWFVSFSDPNGVSFELREGKFFVTGNSLKPSDLIIEDPSVSTPHALVNISVEKGVWVQDLMSDQGTYVSGAESVEFTREEAARKLEHDDVVRFGNIEFVVSIISRRK